jgi:hypothetical protein
MGGICVKRLGRNKEHEALKKRKYVEVDIMNADITSYNEKQQGDDRLVCDRLAELIAGSLLGAESKVWHGAPVWFLQGNPIAGYSVTKKGVQLLFWSGQSFDGPGLEPIGKFKAAGKYFTTPSQIDNTVVNDWLGKSKTIQWDYKNIIKRQGELVQL